MKTTLPAVALFLATGVLTMPGVTQAAQRQATASTGSAAAPKSSPGKAREFVSPFSTVYARIRFTDDGTTLTVNGSGGGFNPGLSYTSFFYGVGSVPNGALACIPPTPNLLTPLQMITAYWLPITGTYRTLYVQKTGTSYVPLTQVSTFSVRYDSTPTLPLTTNLNPGRFWLNSCGYIR